MANDKKPLLKLPAKMGVVAQVINSIIDRLGEGGIDFTPQSPLELTEDGKLQLKQDGIGSPLKLTEEGVLTLDATQMKTVNGISVVGQGNINIATNPFCVETQILLYGVERIGRDDTYIETKNILSDGTVNNKVAKDCNSFESIIKYIYNNTHAYVGKIIQSGPRKTMQIKQLKDNNYNEFIDGSNAENYIKDINSEGFDVYIKMPEFYYKVSTFDENKVLISFKLVPDTNYSKWYTNELVGVYPFTGPIAGIMARSISNSSYSDSAPLQAIQNSVVNRNETYRFVNGQGYKLTDSKTYSLLNCLLIGYYNYGSSRMNFDQENIHTFSGTGNTYGKIADGEDSAIKFFGIESLWGDVWQYIPNIKLKPSLVDNNIILDFKLNDDSENILHTSINENYYENDSLGIDSLQPVNDFIIPKNLNFPNPNEIGRLYIPELDSSETYDYQGLFIGGNHYSIAYIVNLALQNAFDNMKYTGRLSFYGDVDIVPNF